MNIKEALKTLESESYHSSTQFVEYGALRRILEALNEPEEDRNNVAGEERDERE